MKYFKKTNLPLQIGGVDSHTVNTLLSPSWGLFISRPLEEGGLIENLR